MKSLINKNYEIFSLLIIAISLSGALLAFRIKFLKSFYLLFLVWNIILAVIPYVITMYLSTIKLTKLKLGIWFCIWLLFLPNAPYIITDLLHLKLSSSSMLWLDILVILSFACTGMLLFFLSLNDMKLLIGEQFKKVPVKHLTTLIIFLCAFGVYLGRFLRYNSWEVISNPMNLLSDIFKIVVYPNQNFQVWLFTLGFGFFLWVGFRLFNKLYSTVYITLQISVTLR